MEENRKGTEKVKRVKTEDIWEVLYLFVVALYVLYLSFATTLFRIPWPPHYEQLLRLFACAVILLKVGYSKVYRGAEWFVCILTGALFGLSWVSTGYGFLLDIPLLAMGAIGVPYKRILKVGFWAGLSVLLLAMLGSFTGCIADLVYSDGGQYKHSFGIVYSTDFAAHVAYLVLTCWVIYETIPVGWMLIGTAGITFFVFYYSGSRCSTIVLGLFVIGILYNFMAEKALHCKIIHTMVKFIDKMLVFLMPFAAFLMIILTLFYDSDNKWLFQLNEVLSGRLRLGKAAIKNYGINMFGTAFDLIGGGGENVYRWRYNFVDSSYVLILVRYGWIILLLICIIYILLVHKALKSEKRRVAIVMAIIAVHSMIEHHYLEISYNLFLIIPFASFHTGKIVSFVTEKGKRGIKIAEIVVFGGLGVILFPKVMGYVRTIVNILHVNNAESHGWFIGLAIGIVGLLGVVIYSGLKIVASFLNKEKLSSLIFMGLIMPVLCLVFFMIKGERIIEQGKEEYRDIIEVESPIIEKLIEDNGFDGKLYVDTVPEVYAREFDGVSNPALSGEGVATQKNVVIIMDKDKERQALIDSGYMFGEISEIHGIYTNSDAARKILRDAGVELADCYNVRKFVDLEEAAALNGLVITENGSLLIRGTEESLVYGPGANVDRGRLRVAYKLQLINCPIEAGYIATVRVTSEWGLINWQQQDINLMEFDESGSCVFIVDVDLPLNMEGIEFALFATEGTVMELQEITYGKIQ